MLVWLIFVSSMNNPCVLCESVISIVLQGTKRDTRGLRGDRSSFQTECLPDKEYCYQDDHELHDVLLRVDLGRKL